ELAKAQQAAAGAQAVVNAGRESAEAERVQMDQALKHAEAERVQIDQALKRAEAERVQIDQTSKHAEAERLRVEQRLKSVEERAEAAIRERDALAAEIDAARQTAAGAQTTVDTRLPALDAARARMGRAGDE